jgi:hypothetical protein
MGRAITRCYDSFRSEYAVISIFRRGACWIIRITVIRTRVAMRLATNDVEAVMAAGVVHEHVQAVAKQGDAAINGQQCAAQKSSTVWMHSANCTAQGGNTFCSL